MRVRSELVTTAVIGGGPAGLAICLAACRLDKLEALLNDGFVIFERSSSFGPGTLGRFRIKSDSLAASFLRFMEPVTPVGLEGLATHEETRSLRDRMGDSIPLLEAASFLGIVGAEMESLAARSSAEGLVKLNTAVKSAHMLAGGGWKLALENGEDGLKFDQIVLATGGRPDLARQISGLVAGRPLSPELANSLFQAQELLTLAGQQALCHRLRRLSNPRVVVVGGSHTALSCLQILLEMRPDWADGSIALVHRSPLRVTYATPDEAIADCCEFQLNDVCAATGRVFPLAGFRSSSRDLARRLLNRPGTMPEARVRLISIADHSHADIWSELSAADIVIPALGYVPVGLPLFDKQGDSINWRSSGMVDGKCRVIDAHGNPILGLFGIGLAAGHPMASQWGEPSFTGQANGLALWQTEIGETLVRELVPV